MVFVYIKIKITKNKNYYKSKGKSVLGPSDLVYAVEYRFKILLNA